MLRKFTFKTSRGTSKNINYFGDYLQFKKSLDLDLFLQYFPQKLIKTLYVEVVLCIILTSHCISRVELKNLYFQYER